MTGFYSWSMRHGSQILFGFALAVAIISFVVTCYAYTAVDQDGLVGAPVWTLATSLVTSLSTAVWPFLGAGLINRIDAWRSRA